MQILRFQAFWLGGKLPNGIPQGGSKRTCARGTRGTDYKQLTGGPLLAIQLPPATNPPARIVDLGHWLPNPTGSFQIPIPSNNCPFFLLLTRLYLEIWPEIFHLTAEATPLAWLTEVQCDVLLMSICLPLAFLCIMLPLVVTSWKYNCSHNTTHSLQKKKTWDVT